MVSNDLQRLLSIFLFPSDNKENFPYKGTVKLLNDKDHVRIFNVSILLSGNVDRHTVSSKDTASYSFIKIRNLINYKDYRYKKIKCDNLSDLTIQIHY